MVLTRESQFHIFCEKDKFELYTMRFVDAMNCISPKWLDFNVRYRDRSGRAMLMDGRAA
jgi:hypothetical protein